MRAPAGIILAGGRATRMGGGDKALLPLGEGTLLSSVIARLEPQVAALALNANGPAERFDDIGLPVLPDTIPDFAGPLAGVLAGLRWAAKAGHSHVVSAAGDTPVLPCDLVPRLQMAAEGSTTGLAIAATPDGWQPTFGLWPTALADDLEEALAGGLRKILHWTDRHGAARATFPDADAFFNVNRPEDLTRAEGMA